MKKINHNISGKVLTLGPTWKNPKGGIAQVLSSYSNIFERFNFIPTNGGSNKLSNLLILIGAVSKYLYSLSFKGIDVVHIHTASEISFFRKSLFVKLGALMNKKIIIHIHGAQFKEFAEKNHNKIQPVLDKCTAVIALSNSWKEYFESEFGCTEVKVIPNIMEYPALIEKENSSGIISFLFLGMFGQRKGVFDLLEVIREHANDLRGKVHFHLGGNGETDKVNDFIRNNNLGEIVTNHGWVSGDKKIELLNKSDIFILPSYNEGLPISILEAMSYGMPIISTNVGGIPEIVDNENGRLITPGNKEEIFSSIEFFINNRDKIKDMGKVSENRAVPHLPENVAGSLTNLYQEILSKQ